MVQLLTPTQNDTATPVDDVRAPTHPDKLITHVCSDQAPHQGLRKMLFFIAKLDIENTPSSQPLYSFGGKIYKQDDLDRFTRSGSVIAFSEPVKARQTETIWLDTAGALCVANATPYHDPNRRPTGYILPTAKNL